MTDKSSTPAPTLAVAAEAGVAQEPALDKAKTVEDLVPMAQTPEHARAVAALSSDVKLPSDLAKVSNAKAKELSEAGLVDDQDLPGKMYRRKVDGFTVRIPNYTFEAYSPELKDEWEEVKLTSDAPAAST